MYIDSHALIYSLCKNACETISLLSSDFSRLFVFHNMLSYLPFSDIILLFLSILVPFLSIPLLGRIPLEEYIRMTSLFRCIQRSSSALSFNKNKMTLFHYKNWLTHFVDLKKYEQI